MDSGARAVDPLWMDLAAVGMVIVAAIGTVVVVVRIVLGLLGVA